MNAFTVSNELLTQPDALQDRAQTDGYLFFQGLIDGDSLLNVRRQILDLCASAGWLESDTDPMEGIAAPGVRHVEPEPGYMHVYRQVMQLEDFHTLAHHPALTSMFDALFGEPTLVHARNIARIIFPQATQFTTPAHQDYIHIQGTENTWTAWIPLGNCPQTLGSLTILPGTHHAGIYPVHEALGAGHKEIDTEVLPFTWVASDFALGDVVLFHSKTIHKGLPNRSVDRLRLSVDYRYQGVSQPIVEGSLLPHGGQVTWEEVYAGWKSDQYQYYWNDKSLQVVA